MFAYVVCNVNFNFEFQMFVEQRAIFEICVSVFAFYTYSPRYNHRQLKTWIRVYEAKAKTMLVITARQHALYIQKTPYPEPVVFQ